MICGLCIEDQSWNLNFGPFQQPHVPGATLGYFGAEVVKVRVSQPAGVAYTCPRSVAELVSRVTMLTVANSGLRIFALGISNYSLFRSELGHLLFKDIALAT